MKVDNFVLLMISIITLIIISLVTECNRGRLKELEDKADKEIKETFFGHLGSVGLTELGEKGFLIKDITEGQYGGRSSQEVISAIGNHNKGEYITKTEYDGYNSNLFNPTKIGTEKNPVECNLTISQTTDINRIPYHSVEPINNYSYGGQNCQDKYGSEYTFQSNNYNVYNIPTIFGMGNNMIELSGDIEFDDENLDNGSLDITIQFNIYYTVTLLDSISTQLNDCNYETSLTDFQNNIDRSVNISKEYPINIKYEIQLIQNPNLTNQYKLVIIVKVILNEVEPFYNHDIVHMVQCVGLQANLGVWGVMFQNNKNNNNLELDNYFNNIHTTIYNNLTNNLTNNEKMLYKFESDTISDYNANEISFSNFNLVSYNSNYQGRVFGDNFKINLTKTGDTNNYTISFVGDDWRDNFGTSEGPSISEFKNMTDISDIITDNLPNTIVDAYSNNANINITKTISPIDVDFNNDTDILNNLEVTNILEKLNNQTIKLS
tara:strand:- start:6382 stop:7854 length:1473 start_codon:yes stop_codon:yes gene_type:complete